MADKFCPETRRVVRRRFLPTSAILMVHEQFHQISNDKRIDDPCWTIAVSQRTELETNVVRLARLSLGIRKTAEENNNIVRKKITSRPLFSTHTRKIIKL